jgi:transposase InsO family protein
MPYGTPVAHNELLPTYLQIYNSRRCHKALGGLTPQQRLGQLQA